MTSNCISALAASSIQSPDALVSVWGLPSRSAGGTSSQCDKSQPKLSAALLSGKVMSWTFPLSDDNLLRESQCHLASTNCISYGRDGSLLATGSNDATIRIWCPETGKLLWTLCEVGKWDSIVSVCFDSRGSRLAAAADNGMIAIWNTDTGKLDGIFNGEGAITLAYGSIATQLASGNNQGHIAVWNPSTGNKVHSVVAHGAPIKGISFANAGTTLISCSTDGNTAIWNLSVSAGLYQREVRQCTDAASCMAVAGSTVAIGRSNGNIDVWNWLMKSHQTFTRHDQDAAISALSFVLGDKMVSASTDGLILLWNLVSGIVISRVSVGTVVMGLTYAAKTSAAPIVAVEASGELSAARAYWEADVKSQTEIVPQHNCITCSILAANCAEMQQAQRQASKQAQAERERMEEDLRITKEMYLKEKFRADVMASEIVRLKELLSNQIAAIESQE